MTDEIKTNDVNLAIVNDSITESGEETSVSEASEVVEYDDIRKKVLELKNRADESYWELGVILTDVYNNDRYRSWGFDSWKEYVEQELDFSMRKAQYFVKLQAWFETMTPAMQAWFRNLGWVKCRMLMAFVVKENAKTWKKRVEGKTVREIEDIIKGEKKQDGSVTGESGKDSDDSRVSSGETLVRRSFSLYSGQDEVVTNAINRAKDIGDTDKEGHALTLICMDYLASSTNLIDTTSLFRHMEDITGYKIVALKSQDGESDDIVFGSEYLEDFVDESENDDSGYSDNTIEQQ